VQEAELPAVANEQGPSGEGRVLFRDAGFAPVLRHGAVQLGPGQLAVIGYGRYADADNDLGVGSDIRIPRSIAPIPAHFTRAGNEIAVTTTIEPPAAGNLRIILRQRNENGSVMRSMTEAKMGQHFMISATQGGRTLRVENQYDKVIWAGLSWAVGEIESGEFVPGMPVEIHLSSADPDVSLHLEGQLYAVEY